MANPEKIASRELVFEIADRMKASGLNPTNRSVLHEIGGGSMTTIAGHLRDWKAQQEIVAPALLETIEVPASVTDAGNHALAAIWQACSAEARREIDTVTEQANQRIKDTEADRDNVLTELAEAESEVNSLQSKITDLDQAVRDSNRERAELLAKNEEFQAETQKARAVADEINRRADELATSLKHERERAEKLEEEVAGLQPVAQRAATAEHENVTLRADIERLREELNAERRLHELASQEERKQAGLAQVAEAEVRHLTAQIADIKAQSEEHLATALKTTDTLHRELENARLNATDLTYKNGAMKGELDALQRQVQEQTVTLRALTQTATPNKTPRSKKPATGQ